MDGFVPATYIADMSKFVRAHRWLALLVAYTVAIQGVLLPLTAAAFAAAEVTLCTAGDGTRAPASHDALGLCAANCGMQCGAQAVAPPPAPATISSQQAQAGQLTSVVAFAAELPIDPHTPHIPRAPPVS